MTGEDKRQLQMKLIPQAVCPVLTQVKNHPRPSTPARLRARRVRKPLSHCPGDDATLNPRCVLCYSYALANITPNEETVAQQDSKGMNLTMDAAEVYREDVYTDRKVGTIRALTPVKSDGSPDAGRPPVYVGEAQILTPMGAIPVTFDIEAASLDEAIRKYAAAAKEGVERTVKEIQEMRRQAASSIVVPQSGMPGGLPGGGKIQIP